MVLEIRLYGDPVLREQGKPVTEFDDKLAKLVEDIKETITTEDAAALAAQQIGEAIMLTVIDFSYMLERNYPIDFDYKYDGKEVPLGLLMPLTVINPKIEYSSEETDLMEEGCMSFPLGVRPSVRRSKEVEISFQDVQGGQHRLWCNGILARCVQHEIDHLNGILFIDHASTQDLRRFESKLKKIKRHTRDLMKQRAKGKK
tara:strand:+ start:20807 stop:21409 length:603 start_codon:yes stop_codon:yes gene_type:complete